MSSITGATFFGWYARPTQETPGGLPASAFRKTAFHWTKRAGGHLTSLSSGVLYGPAQALQLLSGFDVLPERA